MSGRKKKETYIQSLEGMTRFPLVKDMNPHY